ncbi:MAG: hypothetical protein GXO77_03925 [Calditrichaeota bacterium]|nr:hypothetical protein [Calditrichota bacterium]
MPDLITLDLKQLLRYIVEQKELDANLILDEGCLLQVEDPKPLVKIFNYFLNYLRSVSPRPLEVSLDLMHDQYLVSMLVYTDATELPPVSENVKGVLEGYSADFKVIHEKNKYVQFKIHFRLS